MSNFLGRIGGKKFILAVLGVVVVVLRSLMGWQIDDAQVVAVAGMISAYAIGQGVADGLSNGATSSVAAAQNTQDAG